jgi:hypothetical protein
MVLTGSTALGTLGKVYNATGMVAAGGLGALRDIDQGNYGGAAKTTALSGRTQNRVRSKGRS